MYVRAQVARGRDERVEHVRDCGSLPARGAGVGKEVGGGCFVLGCVPVIVGLRLLRWSPISLVMGMCVFLNEKIASRGSAPHPARAHALDPLFTFTAISGTPFGSPTQLTAHTTQISRRQRHGQV